MKAWITGGGYVTAAGFGTLSDKTQPQIEIRYTYLTELHRTIQNLDDNRFVVRKQLRYVKEYSNKPRWLNLSRTPIIEYLFSGKVSSVKLKPTRLTIISI